MAIDASTIAPNIDAVATAIADCCVDIIDNELMMNAELGMGVSQAGAALAAAYSSCCTQQIAATMVTIPPTTVTDPNTGVVTVTNPGYTGHVNGLWAVLNSGAINAQTAAADQNYQDYLNHITAWRLTQIVPTILSLLANGGVLFEQLELYNDMLDCSIALLDCIKEETAELKALSVGTLIPAIQQHTDDLMGKFSSAAALTAICDQRDEIAARSETLFDCFENTFKPELTQYLADFTGEMFSHGAAGSEQQIELRDLNRLLRACFENFIKPSDEAVQGNITTAINQMSDKVDVACDFLTECSEKLGIHWDTAYAQKDGDYACAAMENATASLEGIQEVRTFLLGCRDAWKAIQETVYHVNEAVHIPELQQSAIDTLPIFKDVADCAFECSEDEKQRYVDTYEAKEAALSVLAMNEACQLHDCFSTIKDWLTTTGSDDLYACWESGWKPKEVEYACDLIDKGIEVLCRFEEELEEFCVNVECFKDHWTRCYEEAECQVNPKLILAGEDACNKQRSVYNWLCERQEHLWEKFEQTWCPWDVQDAQYFCDFWLKTNPLNELCDNHECQQDLADLLKDCYEDIVLPWEKAYIQEICQMEKYITKYCEVEDQVLAHIRGQSQLLAERAIKQTPRHCSGASKQQQILIHNERIRQEAAAMASANRDERFWEVQECDRRHRYVMDVLERLGKRFPDHALQFYAGSSEIMDGVLARMHERLLRGYEYVRNTNDYARSVLNANQAAVDASERATQLGHFYPDIYVRGKSEYLRHADNYLGDVHDVLRIGQLYPQLASQNRERAMNTVDRSANWGFQHMQHGIRHVQTALEAKKVAADTAQSAQANALNSYAIGQDYLRLAIESVRENTQQGQMSIGAANNAQQVGAQYATLSADKMESVMRSAIQAIGEGNRLLEHNRLYAGQIQTGYDSVVKNGLAGFELFLQEHQLGLNYATVAGRFDQITLQSAVQNMSEACRFLSANHCCTAQAASGSSNGALGTATGLLSGAAQGITSSLDGIIGSFAALNQPPSPPSAPFGQISGNQNSGVATTP